VDSIPKKKVFISLLDRVYFRGVEEIIVLYKDRLSRFDFELSESICKQAACKIIVHNEANSNEQDVTQELSEGLLYILTVFVARNNGLRAGRNRKRRRELEGNQEN
jgi:predicted site-specific integrase-resolvase